MCVFAQVHRGYLLQIFKVLVSLFGFPGHVNGCHPHGRVDGDSRLEKIVNKVVT